jgi:hypothetical protein
MNSQCSTLNGTFHCDKDQGHDGIHAGKFWDYSLNKYRTARFTDAYSAVKIGK